MATTISEALPEPERRKQALRRQAEIQAQPQSQARDEEPQKQEQPQSQPAAEGGSEAWDSMFSQSAPEEQKIPLSSYLADPENQQQVPIKPGYIRRIIDFSPSTYKVLEELAKGGLIGDALRDAIAASKWFKDTREEGVRILVECDGELHEVITIKYPPDK